jgi:hypothetical protein
MQRAFARGGSQADAYLLTGPRVPILGFRGVGSGQAASVIQAPARAQRLGTQRDVASG